MLLMIYYKNFKIYEGKHMKMRNTIFTLLVISFVMMLLAVMIPEKLGGFLFLFYIVPGILFFVSAGMLAFKKD